MLVVSSGSPYVSTVYQNKLDSLILYVSVAGQATQNFHGGSLKYQFAFFDSVYSSDQAGQGKSSWR